MAIGIRCSLFERHFDKGMALGAVFLKDILTKLWYQAHIFERHSYKGTAFSKMLLQSYDIRHNLFERRHSYKVMAVFLKLQSYALGTDFSERHGIRRSLSEIA